MLQILNQKDAQKVKLQKQDDIDAMQISHGGSNGDGAKEGNGAHGEELISWTHLSSEVDIVFLITTEIVASVESSDFLLVGVHDSVFTAEAATPQVAAVGNNLPCGSFFSVGHIMAAAEGAASLPDSTDWGTISVADFVGDAAAPWVVAR